EPPRDTALRCSFCNKSQRDVAKLIAGPNKVYICDECIDICLEIVSEDRESDLARSARLSTPVWCGLCHAFTPSADMIAVADRGFLCTQCVAAVETAASRLAVRREELDSPVAAQLIAALNAELAAEYDDPRANHFRLEPREAA